MGGKGNSAAKAGVGYTIGNILVKGINFLSLPLFSRLMTTEEFGIYNVFVSYEAILTLLVGFAMHSCLRSANVDFKGKINEFTSSVSITYILTAVGMLVIAFLMKNTLSGILSFSFDIIVLLVLYSFGSAILTLYNNRISIDYQYKSYLLVALINSVGNVFFSLLFMLTFCTNNRELGRILGTTFTMFALSVVLLVILYRKSRPKVNYGYWKYAFVYSLPIVPHGISQVLLAQFDRIMIRSIVSASAAGIYSLAGNIKLILTIITTSIATAWGNWFYEAVERKEIKKIQRCAIQLTALFMILSVGLMTVSPEMILILGGKNYEIAKYVAVPMILDAFILFIYNVIVQIEYYKKKTSYIMIGTIIAAVINIITNYYFIQMYGFIAAAYTTLFAYICYLVMHLIISHKLAGFSVLPGKWLFAFVAITAISGIFNIIFIENIWIRLLLCVVIILPSGWILLRDLKKQRGGTV